MRVVRRILTLLVATVLGMAALGLAVRIRMTFEAAGFRQLDSLDAASYTWQARRSSSCRESGALGHL